jgi:LysM repeat protein
LPFRCWAVAAVGREGRAGVALQIVISARGWQEVNSFAAKAVAIARRILHRVLASLAALLALGAAPAPSAGAHVAHTVQRGETLWSIAAASNLTTRALAAANRMPETANVILGERVWIPSEAEAAAALAGGPVVGGQSPAPTSGVRYAVRPGDTLSSIAARSGVSAEQVAPMNGLDPAGPLLAGTALELPTGAELASQPNAAPTGTTDAAPQPTNEVVSPALVQQIAAEHGVSPSLAAAIAKMESGFSNGLVSSANARGVMQILPETWDFIASQLAISQLNPASAGDNVHAGVLYLQRLLRDTGGDEAATTGAYYQGLASVRTGGVLPTTHRYVDDVMALRSQLGGP